MKRIIAVLVAALAAWLGLGTRMLP